MRLELLEELAVEANSISSVEQFAGCQLLSALYAAHNRIHDIVSLRERRSALQFRSLIVLDIRYNMVRTLFLL